MRRIFPRIARFLIACTITCGVSTNGQSGPEAKFYANSRLVVLPVSVVDPRGVPISGLQKESFRVIQDGAARSILAVGEEEMPVSIGIVLDTSGSMEPVLSEAKAIVGALLRSAGDADEAFLATVSTRPDVDGAFEPDLGSIMERGALARGGGATALADTIYGALHVAKSAHNAKRALVVISDGVDNHSRRSRGELMSMAEEAGTAVYSLCIFETPSGKKPIELREEHEGVAFLQELSYRTGGIAVVARRGDAVNGARRISDAIRCQYLVAYSPGDQIQAGVRHRVQVTLNAPGAKAYTRSALFFNDGME
jgi:VWFA-related protein